MSRLQTMGTSSCATFAISWFKNGKEYNEQYRADPAKFRKGFKLDGLSADDFYDEIILPIAQPLGRSADMPFDMLMDEVDAHSNLKTKFIIAVLNENQVQEGYWPERLADRGFTAIDRTKNTVGQPCTIYTRNNNRMPLPEEEGYEEHNPFENDEDEEEEMMDVDDMYEEEEELSLHF